MRGGKKTPRRGDPDYYEYWRHEWELEDEEEEEEEEEDEENEDGDDEGPYFPGKKFRK
jgi:hypothetical protein